MRSPEYSSVNTHTNTHAHTRGSLRCWQHSGTPPLFIWLLRKKKGRKHSGDYLNFLTRRPADRLISHRVSDVCLPRVSLSERGEGWIGEHTVDKRGWMGRCCSKISQMTICAFKWVIALQNLVTSWKCVLVKPQYGLNFHQCGRV